jgi:segregation and condensation protein B
MTKQETGMEAAQTPRPDESIDSEFADRPVDAAPGSVRDDDADEICDDELVEGLVENRAADDSTDEEMPEADEPCDATEDDEPDDADEEDEPDGEIMTDMDSVVEAILFAADEPMTPSRLVSVVEAGSTKQVRRSVKNLNKKYARTNCAFRIEEIAGGYQMMTLPAYNPWLRKLLRVRTDNKLTQAALETLAIIAYKQPLIRADIEAIRGVASGEVIRNLMYKGLVKIVGRAEVLGRPMLYGTTRRFLDVFGLSSLRDLPNVEELKKPE